MLTAKRYHSKAIMGAAHGVQFPEIGPLHAAEFSGGDATVKAKLSQLGFRVESMPVEEVSITRPHRTSDILQIGRVYTRTDLRERFAITDAAINTGLFQPKDICAPF